MPRNFDSYAALQAALDLAPLTPGAFRFAKQFAPATFTCYRCGEHKPLKFDGAGTGYGVTTQHMVDHGHVARANEMVCYACAGETDRADMLADGRAVLYLTHEPIQGRAYPFADGRVTNWPGTLSIKCRVKRGAHNVARYRYDAWFTGPDGKPWHGVQYGDNTQILHCRRVKG